MHLKHLYKQLSTGILLYLLILPLACASAPDILVTLKPLHSLVSNLTKGITQPKLLIKGFQTPHNYNMRPSDRRLIKQSDIIIFAAPSIESFIPGIVNSLDNKHIINLSQIPDLHKLANRLMFKAEHKHSHTVYDGHLWLSIQNAKSIIEYLHAQFIIYDPEHKNQYTENKKRTISRLNNLNKKIHEQMQQISDKAFLMFHDAFQYFEDEQGLKKAFFITSTPEHKIGIRQIKYLRSKIKQQQISCVFYEPPLIPRILHTIIEDKPVKVLPLDPLGTSFKAGEDLYFELLTNISKQLYSCLRHL